MKDKIKKLSVILLVGLMSIGLISNNTLSASATEGGTMHLKNRLMIQFKLSNGHDQKWQDREGLLMIGNQVVFCADYNVDVGSGKTYTADTLAYGKFSAAVKAKLSTIALFGYGANGDNSNSMYMATQFAIWEAIHNGSIEMKDVEESSMNHDSAASQKVKVSASETRAKLQNLRNKIKKYSSLFQKGQTSIALDKDVVLTGIGEKNAVTVTDKNGILELFDVKNVDGIAMKKSGNSLKVWATQFAHMNKTIPLKLNIKNDFARTTPLVFKSPDLQDTLRMGYSNPADLKLNFKIDIRGNLHVTKTDITGTKEVAGAKLKVTDKAGKTVDEWTSDSKAHIIKGLLSGEKYTLTEVAAPKGYKVAAPITFTMNADGSVTKVVMKDESILTDIQVNKIDSMTKKIIKSKDFKFGIYSDEACTKLIKEVSADTSTGTATFKNVEYGTYYIKEIAAPKGYLLSKEVVKVVVDEKLETVGKTYSISYQNTPLPATAEKVQTGDGTSIFLLTAMIIVSMSAIFFLIRRKKNNV